MYAAEIRIRFDEFFSRAFKRMHQLDELQRHNDRF